MTDKTEAVTPDDKRDMARQMLVLHEQIRVEIESEQVDPGRLMRLIGAGVNQCMVALATILSDGDLPEPDALGLEPC